MRLIRSINSRNKSGGMSIVLWTWPDHNLMFFILLIKFVWHWMFGILYIYAHHWHPPAIVQLIAWWLIYAGNARLSDLLLFSPDIVAIIEIKTTETVKSTIRGRQATKEIAEMPSSGRQTMYACMGWDRGGDRRMESSCTDIVCMLGILAIIVNSTGHSLAIPYHHCCLCLACKLMQHVDDSRSFKVRVNERKKESTAPIEWENELAVGLSGDVMLNIISL